MVFHSRCVVVKAVQAQPYAFWLDAVKAFNGWACFCEAVIVMERLDIYCGRLPSMDGHPCFGALIGQFVVRARDVGSEFTHRLMNMNFDLICSEEPLPNAILIFYFDLACHCLRSEKRSKHRDDGAGPAHFDALLDSSGGRNIARSA